MKPLPLVLACTALALLAATAPCSAQMAAVAVVSEIDGAVRLVRGKDNVAAKLLTDLVADSRLELAEGARVVLLVFSTGDEATAKGPATMFIQAASIRAAPPTALSMRTSSVGTVKLRRKDLAQSAIVMRATEQTVRLPLLSLADTVTLEDNPAFRWAPVEGCGPYRFELFDEAGRIVHAATLEDTALRLPGRVKLEMGHAYTWEVSARRANGLEYSNFGDFTPAAAALRAEAARLRPKDGASLSDRIAYAMWLDANELSDAARETWNALSRERPEEAVLRRMAAP